MSESPEKLILKTCLNTSFGMIEIEGKYEEKQPTYIVVAKDLAAAIVRRYNSYQRDKEIIEKLKKALEDAEVAYNHAINITPSGDYRNFLTELNIERVHILSKVAKSLKEEK